MTTIAGPLAELSIDGQILAVAADTGGKRDLGGFTGEHKPTGSSGAILVLTPKVWVYGGIKVVVDDAQDTQKFLQRIANAGVDVPCKFQQRSGARYQGRGCITGPIEYLEQEGCCEIQLTGPGELEKQ